MVELSTAALVERLRRNGVRVTAPRRAVVEALSELGSHATAEQLHDHVRRRYPGVSASSVYRTMDLLSELGIVTHVHLGHGPAEYHLVGDEHAHLVCDGCGSVFEIPPEVSEPFVGAVRRRLGFAPDLRHFALTGRCADCAAFDAGAAGQRG